MKRIFLIMALVAICFPFAGYSAESTDQPAKANQKPLYWVDSMEPDVHYSAPGKSRMGMDLVPVYSNKNQATSSAVNPPMPAKE